MKHLLAIAAITLIWACSGTPANEETADNASQAETTGGDVVQSDDLVETPEDLVTKDEAQPEEEVAQDMGQPEEDVPVDTEPPCLCQTALECAALFPDLGPCEKVVCVECECVSKNEADGTQCDDGDACTNNDACADGVCEGNDVCSGECGDKTCDATETCETCPEDCGMCPPPVCDVNGDCDEGFYCNTGDCASSTGMCEIMPQGCDAVYDPVCGCDGETYSNACQAAASGITIDMPGECGMAGCFGNNMCPPEEYCLFAQCDAQAGECILKPEICTKEWMPVCGCDNVTYGNACEAAFSGVSVDYDGECNANPGNCLDNGMCAATEFCAKLDCSDSQGVCAPKPEACIALYDPVCGCDGNTYGNGCEAAAAGMSVNYGGECGEGPAVCWDNSMCLPAQYCAMDSCDAGMGECAAKPEICPMILDPVCGCDGKTYDNACLAASEGMNIAYKGNCEVVEGCLDNDMCGFDEYCAFSDCEDNAGMCMPKPQACPFVWDPVCGCDGQTYGNACEAAATGMSVDYDGECEAPVPTCKVNTDCPGGHYCYFEICDQAPGTCNLKPEACPAIYDPVCGCDGKTYGNACEAAAAGVSVGSDGECA